MPSWRDPRDPRGHGEVAAVRGPPRLAAAIAPRTGDDDPRLGRRPTWPGVRRPAPSGTARRRRTSPTTSSGASHRGRVHAARRTARLARGGRRDRRRDRPRRGPDWSPRPAVAAGRRSGTPRRDASGAPDAMPRSAILLGDPINVSAALAIRDGTEVERPRDGGRRLPLAIACGSAVRSRLGHGNPTFLRCPQAVQWLMQRAGDPDRQTRHSSEGGPPRVRRSGHRSRSSSRRLPGRSRQGSCQPPFPSCSSATSTIAARPLASPRTWRACGETFVVDRVAAVDGVEQPVMTHAQTDRWDEATQTTVTEHPNDLEERRRSAGARRRPAGDHRVAPARHDRSTSSASNRSLANDEFVPYIGNPATLVWLVTAVDLRDGVADRPDVRPVRRLELVRGGDRGGRPDDRASRRGPDRRQRHLRARSGRSVCLRRCARDCPRTRRPERRGGHGPATHRRCDRPRRVRHPGLVRRPEPGDASASRRSRSSIRPRRPATSARHWLLDQPESVRRRGRTARGAIRPSGRTPSTRPCPLTCPFDVPATWVDGRPVPQPVVVLGHFNGRRQRLSRERVLRH